MSKVESTGDSASREFKRFITSGRRRMLSKIYHPFGASFIVNAEEALYGHGNLVTTPNIVGLCCYNPRQYNCVLCA